MKYQLVYAYTDEDVVCNLGVDTYVINNYATYDEAWKAAFNEVSNKAVLANAFGDSYEAVITVTKDGATIAYSDGSTEEYCIKEVQS